MKYFKLTVTLHFSLIHCHLNQLHMTKRNPSIKKRKEIECLKKEMNDGRTRDKYKCMWMHFILTADFYTLYFICLYTCWMKNVRLLLQAFQILQVPFHLCHSVLTVQKVFPWSCVPLNRRRCAGAIKAWYFHFGLRKKHILFNLRDNLTLIFLYNHLITQLHLLPDFRKGSLFFLS